MAASSAVRQSRCAFIFCAQFTIHSVNKTWSIVVGFMVFSKHPTPAALVLPTQGRRVTGRPPGAALGVNLQQRQSSSPPSPTQ
jgi:hypothetical protein